ncbi:MAG TPA: hypothetical protein VKE94_09975, partial [Gemmataceae bacterium]|nr:hypothetical protein [Gemmataceae bacterium]
SGTLTFAPGETEKFIVVDAAANDTFDPYKSLLVSLFDVQGAVIADGQALGTIIEDDNIGIVLPAPAVQGVQIGDGSKQRSMVSSVTVVFNQPVIWDWTAATLQQAKGATYAVVAENPSGDDRTFVLHFVGPNMAGGSLPDGSYTLRIPARSVVGVARDDQMAADFTVSFHRLFGDADGDRDVDNTDRKAFMKAFKAKQGQPGYVSYFDYDSDGDVDNVDLVAFNRPHRDDQVLSAQAIAQIQKPNKLHVKSTPTKNNKNGKVIHSTSSSPFDHAAVDAIFAGIAPASTSSPRPRWSRSS